MKVHALGWRQAPWALLILAALLMRVVVPQGYMVDTDQSGGIEITVCNSDGTWVIPMKDTGKEHEDDGDGTAKACSFSGHSASATPAEGTAPLPLPQLAEAAFDAMRERALSPTSPPRLPSARAPPITA